MRVPLNLPAHMLKHLLIIATITFFVGIVYSKVTGAYFCSYDDFNEIHRAAFEDTRQPSRILTTSHFDSYKYRPLNRAITLLTYSVGDGRPFYFRVRNLIFHLLNVALVYGISWLLFKDIFISGIGAALFGLHLLQINPLLAQCGPIQWPIRASFLPY